jgi:hypothetical protein
MMNPTIADTLEGLLGPLFKVTWLAIMASYVVLDRGQKDAASRRKWHTRFIATCGVVPV